MKVTVNDREMLFGEDMTQGEIIAQLQGAIKENNLVIMEAEVNGVKSSINLAEIAGLNDIDTLSLMVGTPGQVITDGLETAVTYLPVLQSGLTDIAAFLQEGREGEGISKFLQVVPGMEWLGQILSGAVLIIDSNILQDSFRSSAAGYGKKLEELLEGWQNRDYVLIADLLEYELAPFIQELVPLISDTLNSLREKE
ncbi:hypothetical protein [Phosphitispora fastidiosa]|uniref:hypothetical protein n=1 Tax=Phosphitispora fastidiosa TaxID=2837202 RepID=UPI001E51C898|nr:hypothetical protein [Phosphitispora fastidiosa]MBU7006405.1 hypothetical protein [Phosphitispora fastidiosa]